MGKTYESIGAEHRAFIEAQPMFFVASAPASAAGHVNLSPKGLDSFRVVDANTVKYLDLTGSGNETAAHVAESGRLTLMFCAFESHPKILRLYCHGRVVTRASHEWTEVAAGFPPHPGIRQVIVATVDSVQTSCGFGVPLLSLVSQRDQLTRWAESKGEAGLVDYRRSRNAVSLDGLLAPATD
ncbi:MAG TPA: pyridoxamine 5'-phosphate oxidase family protein [Vicinamibacterales bacterium]|nr:pyridoxamine 5'-phosphate oxidase family protein [Vicinamibacterales bacterium]